MSYVKYDPIELEKIIKEIPGTLALGSLNGNLNKINEL